MIEIVGSNENVEGDKYLGNLAHVLYIRYFMAFKKKFM